MLATSNKANGNINEPNVEGRENGTCAGAFEKYLRKKSVPTEIVQKYRSTCRLWTPAAFSEISPALPGGGQGVGARAIRVHTLPERYCEGNSEDQSSPLDAEDGSLDTRNERHGGWRASGGESRRLSARVAGCAPAGTAFYFAQHHVTGTITVRIQMKGLDANWLDVGETRFMSYNHLPPGRYEFSFPVQSGWRRQAR